MERQVRKDDVLRAPSCREIRASSAKSWTVLLAIPLLMLQEAPPVNAEAKTPSIITDAVLRVSPGAEAALRIDVVSDEPIPHQTMLIILGLPSGIRLSHGRLFGPGVWVVPQKDLARLKIRVPADATHGSALTVALTTIDGSRLATTRIALLIDGSDSGAREQKPSTGLNSGKAELTKAFSPAERALAILLLEKANTYMEAGNVILARQLYQGAAERGLAEGALALARTYDQSEMARIKNLVGVQPDPKLAAKWYQKAKDLGSPQAQMGLR
jgi:hypothetical protein